MSGLNILTSFPFARGRILALAAIIFLSAGQLKASTVWLDELDLSNTSQDWGQPQKDKSVDGHSLRIGKQSFDRGLGTHAVSALYVDLHGSGNKFSSLVGLDSEETNSLASIEFFVIGDGKILWRSGVMKAGEPAKAVEVPLSGIQTLLLRVGDANDGISFDHADWAEAKFEYSGAAPVTAAAPREVAVILTPTAPSTPRINGPRVFGVRPGHPVLFTVPATGDRPMKFSCGHLPEGLQFDPATGQLTGSLSKPGNYDLTLRAENRLGASKAALRIVCGPEISLTPPMGWNSWNCFAGAVDDQKVRAAADALVASGLINHGWTYINIDDCWEDSRDAEGRIQSNKKFPDMKALTDYVHSKGLKIGIYSSPGPRTCGGFEASWQHEQLDAQQYAAWGFDYLKYDWCSYEQVQDKTLPEQQRLMKPYKIMRTALDSVNRDIVFSLCQYGMGDVWKWGAQVGGNCWRTTGDISDSWGSMANIGFNQNGHGDYAGPGHWNDPDMLVVGRLGWGNLRPTHLTPNEQYTHISLWCLLASPLLIGCDMSQLDDFTLNLLSNDEVLAVNQDPLGKEAARVAEDGDFEVWAKTMQDGSKAIGLFNRSEAAADVRADWKTLGLHGKHKVRDLWRQRDLGKFADSFTANVPRHGVVMIRVW
ncbi:MAG TPA: NPCBM/NEW2 domain-containing protein [Verrucomicrobiae bacterium]|nr:NPCBM/NEW2 domain-containing protein [Verrucomicrobiae bacterium]